jgi:uncharacterized repeat protein (TIGR03803 family)
VLHDFPATATDGFFPDAGVIFDAAGNLYGTTSSGGAYGYGTVFELSPTVGGGWIEKILHNFDVANGASPTGLIFDPSGNLYGTTSGGGDASCDCGTVFKLTPRPDGEWTECELHTFTGYGEIPEGGVIMDAAGNLFGTASAGTDNYGLVFEITP